MFQSNANHDARSPVLILSGLERLGRHRPLVFDRLNKSEHDLVMKSCTPQLATRHSRIFRQGEIQRGIYFIQSGGVRVFYTAPSGREITRAYWFASNFIGGPDVFGESPNMWSAIAVRDTRLLMLPSSALLALCNKIPNLAVGLIEAMAFKGRCYSAMAQMLGTRSAGQRMNQVILHLIEMYGEECNGDIVIKAPITHVEIAHMVGASRQWVTIGLRRLQTKGILDVSRGKLVIHDVASLSKAA